MKENLSDRSSLLVEPERFDWPLLTVAYPWIEQMKGVPQNPLYHAEGDVWIHTGMVAEALRALPEWQALSGRARSLLYAAALLHDVAKFACTEIDENGVPSSPNHTRRGEPMARVILEECGVRTYADRETVAKLVRHHGLPLWFLEKSAMERTLVRASMDVRLDWVALLAEADVRGRLCTDQQNLLDTVSLFRESIRELGCDSLPRSFVSDHARFSYFRNVDYPLHFAAFDDRTFTVTMLCGLPGSGKDTWIRQHGEGLPVISLDAIRSELKVAPGTNQSQVMEVGKERAKEFLRSRRSFLWNATSLTRLVRDPLIDLFSSYGARMRIVVCHASLQRTLAQNAQREGNARVPVAVIEEMLRRFEPPSLADCHELVIHDVEAV